jgi:hypothetical protein
MEPLFWLPIALIIVIAIGTGVWILRRYKK